jgi:hypothetical protein
MPRLVVLHLEPTAGGIFWWHAEIAPVAGGPGTNILNRPGGVQEWKGNFPDAPTNLAILAIGAGAAEYTMSLTVSGTAVPPVKRVLVNGKDLHVTVV